MGDPPNYDPEEKDSIAAMAARTNHTPDEVAYDYLAAGAERAHKSHDGRTPADIARHYGHPEVAAELENG